MNREPCAFCSFGGYRRFCESWWSDLGWYVTGLCWTASYNRDNAWWRTLRWGLPGWAADIHTHWHRARYGWAPRDTWSLDHYLNQVLAGSLEYLAETAHGAPAGYGSDQPEETNFEQWDLDLRRWSNAFSEDPSDVDIYDVPEYTQHRAEEARRRANLQRALREVIDHWESLWN